MTAAFLDVRTGVGADLTPPVGTIIAGKMIKYLGYPIELFSVGSHELPQTLPGDTPDKLPRIGLLPPGGFLLWVVVGDYGYDGGAAALTGPEAGLSAEAIQARPSVTVGSIAPLGASDNARAVETNIMCWTRQLGLGPHHYLTLFGFAPGSGANPPAALANASTAFTVRDYT